MTDVLTPALESQEKDIPGRTAPSPAWLADEEPTKEKAGMGPEAPAAPEADGQVAAEPSTLPWAARDSVRSRGKSQRASQRSLGKGDGGDGDGERASVRSESVSLRGGGGGGSRTESEREYGLREKRKTGEGWEELEKEREREMEVSLGKGEKGEDVEEEEEGANVMPEKAAAVFSPSVTILQPSIAPESPRGSVPGWDEDMERRPFLPGAPGSPVDDYYHDWHGQAKPSCCGGTNRDALKVGAAMFSSAILFPFLVWGGYAFLPFDAPLLSSPTQRLVYTLRCSVFAAVPIVLGVLVLGVARVRYGAVKPRCEGEEDRKEVSVHRRYVDDSISLFLLYFLQLGVMAAYLSQDLLKLVPLLTIIFTFGRLVYWIAAAWGSSVRGFGFGFSFLPILTMLVANLYFVFMIDSAGSVFAGDRTSSDDSPPPGSRQRFWG